VAGRICSSTVLALALVATVLVALVVFEGVKYADVRAELRAAMS
jgi:hypothetical protein